MTDFGRSSDPHVQAQLDRLAALSLPQGRFGLETMRALLGRLGDPHLSLPPVFHVAGTNGKGSVCAFLRAMLEAGGHRVHVATSPHLVRYNERIRIAGRLIEDARLAQLLEEVLDAGEDLAPSFFEATIAASFLAFASEPANACVIEVGLGGRLDATNVIARPAVCAIASLGIDHARFLLIDEEGAPSPTADPLVRIAFEKAGIAKAGAPLVTQGYRAAVEYRIAQSAALVGAPLFVRGSEWFAEVTSTCLAYRDRGGALSLPLPQMAGAHQADNAALAVAMLRHQEAVEISRAAMAEGIRGARWPARLQRLEEGTLTALAPGHAVWLDGGHNADAGAALARHFSGRGNAAERLHLVIAMLANRDPAAILDPLAPSLASITAVPIAGSEAHGPDAYPAGARWAESMAEALERLPDDGLPVLIAGSLYLAGQVLEANGEVPT